MKSLGVSRYALAMGVTAALLAGCDGSQPPIGAPGATQRSDTAARANRGRSWMLPETKGDLIYATSDKTYIISYSTGEVIGTFKSPPARSTCSDGNGNVFFPVSQLVYEYPHGGTKDIAILHDGNYVGYGCAIDSKTGNLAVANGYNLDYSDPGNIAIFDGASGRPQYYGDPEITSYYSCTYDDHGNLFAVGSSETSSFLLAELPYGSATFKPITVDKPVSDFGQILWDGKHLALATHERRQIYRLSVVGSQATVVGITQLWQIRKRGGTFALRRNMILTPSGAYDRRIGFWDYPRGGKPVRTIGPYSSNGHFINALTISVGSRGD